MSCLACALFVALMTSRVTAQEKPDPTQSDLLAAEKNILGAKSTKARTTRALAYVARSIKDDSLARAFPPNEVERAILEVLRDQVAGEGVELQERIGQHVLILAPPGWLAAIGAPRLRATLDAAMILLHDLTGCSVELSRGRRIVVMCSPKQPPERAQTLGAVVRFGKRWLVKPPPWSMLFHELGHEMFPGSIRPRHETFNEMWPHIGRQYIYQHLGMKEAFEHDRQVFRSTMEKEYLASNLTLDQLGPYNPGAGVIQRIFEAGCVRKGIYDWAPVQRLFRAAAAIPSEPSSFHHRQEILAWLIREHLGVAAHEAATKLGFNLDPKRRAAIKSELKTAAPAHARVLAFIRGPEKDEARAACKDLVKRFPGSPWALDAAMYLAAQHMDQNRSTEARRNLESAGFILDWHVIGPFDSRDGKGLLRPFGPETDTKIKATHAGALGQVTWRPVTASLATGRVDLNAIMNPNDGVVAYLQATFKSDRDREALLLTGSDDGIAIWLNGEMLQQKNVYRGLTLDNDLTRCCLKKGSNILLLKISEGGEAWEACCRLTLPDGKPIRQR